MTRFEKGKSGNPGGRPKAEPGFREACRELSKKALKALEAILGGTSASGATARVQAARVVLEHGFGKPTQTIENVGGESRDNQEALDAVQAILHPDQGEAPAPDNALAAQLERHGIGETTAKAVGRPKGNGEDKAKPTKPKEAGPKRKFSGGGMATEY